MFTGPMTASLPAWHTDALAVTFTDTGPGGVAYDEAVTVADCSYGKLAWGNCDTVSYEIIAELQYLGNKEIGCITVVPDDFIAAGVNFHTALIENDLVIDYTIRQFGDDFPFPFVGTVDDWVNAINATGRTVWSVDNTEYM